MYYINSYDLESPKILILKLIDILMKRRWAKFRFQTNILERLLLKKWFIDQPGAGHLRLDEKLFHKYGNENLLIWQHFFFKLLTPSYWYKETMRDYDFSQKRLIAESLFFPGVG